MSCSALAGMTLQLLACLAREQLLAACSCESPVRSSRKSLFFLYTLKHFFTLSHSLPLQESHLNIGLLIAEIQANLTRNKANKMVDKIQPYSAELDWEELFTKFDKTNQIIGALRFENNFLALLTFDHLHSLMLSAYDNWVGCAPEVYSDDTDGSCKVEFYQPSCWLYSVSNLLVFQQLVTLYLGGILVRVVSEIVWRNA